MGKEAEAERSFQVVEAKQLLLTAVTDKPTYLTGDVVNISGKLTYGGKPVYRASIDINILRSDGNTDKKSALTRADGTFKVSYPVPKTQLKAIPPSPEQWNVTLTASPFETEYGKTSADTSFQVLPVYLKLHSVHLVQVIDKPVVDGKTHLIADKAVGLRVMVSCPSLQAIPKATPPEVKVKLEIGWGATDIQPKEGETEKTVPIKAERTPVDFIFILNPGTYTIGAIVDPDFEYMDTTYSSELHMQVKEPVQVHRAAKALKIKFVTVELPLSLIPEAQDTKEFLGFCADQVRFIKQVFPLPPSNVTCKYAQGLPPYRAKASRLTLALWLSNMTARERHEGMRDWVSPVRVVGLLPQRWWATGEEGCNFSLTAPQAPLVKYPTQFSSITAHELGHTFGLYILPFWGEQYQQFREWGLPADTGLIIKDNRIYNLLNPEEAKIAFPNPFVPDKGMPAYCFMGLASDHHGAWVSNEVYSALLWRFMDPPPQKLLYTSGIIFTDGTVELGDWFITEGEPDDLFGEYEGEYIIECISSSDEVVYSADFGTSGEDCLFSFAIPFPEESAEVIVRRGEKILVRSKRSKNPPTVTVLSPRGGESLSDSCEVEWEAADPDGDELTYAVLYSSNGGEDWSVLTTNLEDKRYNVDLKQLPGGDRCLIKVAATDGFHTGYAQSAPFSVAEKGMLVFIDSPQDGEIYQAGEAVILTGITSDYEYINPAHFVLEWTSNLDGKLGTGETVSIDKLSGGNHQITLTATDTHTDRSGSAAVNITVEGTQTYGGNRPPVASFSIMPENPEVGDYIVVASTSSDPDGDMLTYSWYVDGVSRFGNSPNWEWENPEAGEHTIKLVVEDSKGGSDEHFMEINVRKGLPPQQLLPIPLLLFATGGVAGLAFLIFLLVTRRKPAPAAPPVTPPARPVRPRGRPEELVSRRPPARPEGPPERLGDGKPSGPPETLD